MPSANTTVFDDTKEELGEKGSSSSEEESSLEELPVDLTWWGKVRSVRRTMRREMSMRRFHLTIISLVGIDLVIVMVELIVGKLWFPTILT